MLDYGIMLKFDDGKLAVRHLLRLLKLLIMLARQRSSDYVQSVIMQLLQLFYKMTKRLPSWNMLKDNMAVFNEEAGEISFSMLARCVLGDTQKRKIDHMSKLYTLLHTFIRVDEDMAADSSTKGKNKTWRRTIKPNSEAIVTTASFFNAILREMSQ